MRLLIGVVTASTAPRLPGVPPRSFHQLRAAIDDAPQEERTTSQLSDHPSSENTGRIRSSLPFGSSKTVVTKGVTWPVFLASMVATSLASVAITYALTNQNMAAMQLKIDQLTAAQVKDLGATTSTSSFGFADLAALFVAVILATD